MQPMTFKNIGAVIKERRMAMHLKLFQEGGMSQGKLANLLKYKNGQFISNVERGLCSVPAKIIPQLAVLLDISPESIADAICKDTKVNYLRYCNIQ